ncbi:hypothetical protein GHT09_016478 [Marmota monax]|uniref:Uncharacterized protein n=1 Tax=Marmota monax TaxID=9995 RepID=A0A834Q7K6_MARMO|nr:hypothetical protein GHT09_016478 [Marmota monax]
MLKWAKRYVTDYSACAQTQAARGKRAVKHELGPGLSALASWTGTWASAGSCRDVSAFGRLGLGSPTRPGSGASFCLFATEDLLWSKARGEAATGGGRSSPDLTAYWLPCFPFRLSRGVPAQSKCVETQP